MRIGALFRRRKRLAIAAVGLLVLTLGGSYAFLSYHAHQELQQALAEADQLDPGWTIEELESKRAAVAEEQNSAFSLIAAYRLLPRLWPFWWFEGAPESKVYDKEEFRALQDSFLDLDPHCQLDDRQIKALRAEMNRAAPALREARKIIDMPRGRYPIQYSADGISTVLRPTQDARHMANLLDLDVVWRCQEKDIDGALDSCRGIFHVGRSVGDEPTLISVLVRIAIHQIAVKKLERVLAQAQVKEASLATLQSLLEEELNEPLLLIGARGDRALMDRLIVAMDKGQVKAWQLPRYLDPDPRLERMVEKIEMSLVPGAVTGHRAGLLRLHNQFVEIAKRPVEEQKKRMEGFEASAAKLSLLVRELSKGPVKVAAAFRRDRAILRCALVTAAVERYRLAQGHWPNKIDDLVSIYLKQVPLDPATGGPIKYRRIDGVVTIYAIGADEQDHAGQVANAIWKNGYDLGLRLWDADKRRLPPEPWSP